MVVAVRTWQRDPAVPRGRGHEVRCHEIRKAEAPSGPVRLGRASEEMVRLSQES